MFIYNKLLALLCLIEASFHLIDTKGLENGYHYKFFPINRAISQVYDLLAVDDYFDRSAGRGRIEVVKQNSTDQIFYDLSSNEAFIIYGHNPCHTTSLTIADKKIIVQQWGVYLPDNSTKDELGPAAFLLKEDGSFIHGALKFIWFFEKFVFKPDLHRPYGFGCKRPLKDNQMVPKLAIESPSFLLKMETNLYHNSIDSINMVKHNGVFSYDVSGDPPLRIIHVPSLLIDYVIDRSTDQCHFTESILVKGSYLRWPYDTKYFHNNLLSPLLLKLERQDLNYFGIEKFESISYEVFEKTVDDFWLTDYATGPVIITYFIPTSGVKKRPMKIRMLQHNVKGHQEYLITYQENIDGFTDDPSRFDLRNCFNTEPTWFQIVFPVVPRTILSMKYLEYFMETELRKKLDFIPINRLPVMKVGHYGPSIYVTLGLLEGVDVRFKYIDKTLSLEPNAVIIEDNDEDCSFSCSDNPDCEAFSYCHNRQCNLFTLVASQTSLPIIAANCTLFVSRTLNIERDKKKDQPNQVASTSKLLHRINLMIQRQKLNLVIDGVSISAQHLFTVSHPDELGGYGELYKDVVGQRIQLNEYKTIMENYELIGNQLFDLSYLDCLTYCQNDDDCSTVSYCTTRSGACVISSLSADEVVENSNAHTEFNDHCSISAKSFTGNFNLLPGRSLGKPVLREIKGKSPEDCAKACIYEKSFNCDAFDHCSPDLINSHCFLYMFHSEISVLGKNSSQIWNGDEKSCNHYARKLSKEYSQFVGRKFSEQFSVTATIEQNSLENCASSCNFIQENCLSFEYCQFIDKTRPSKILRRCRLSSYQILTQDEHIQKTNNFCSVYSIMRNNDYVHRSLPFDKVEEHPHFYLTLFAGFIAIISGTIISAFITSLFLAKKRS